jgi:gamma-glutamyltranspeptidase/glutathione hydrolase
MRLSPGPKSLVVAPLALLTLLGVLETRPCQAQPVERRPVLRSERAMVVSRHPLASQVGAMVLRDGGNAVDAAVAVSMALAVVLPQAGNIGGGGFLLYHRPDDELFTFIDYRETAPAATHRDFYVDAGGRLDTLRVRSGHEAAGVPGTLAGLHLAWSKYGKLPWSRLLDDAIQLAEQGFEVNDELHRSIVGARHLARFPAAMALLFKDGEALQPGARLVQPELASTLRKIATSGALAFYEGEIADALIAEMRRGAGVISRQDLAAYRAIERQPVRGRYRDLELVSAPPPSSGGIAMLQILGMLEHLDLGAREPKPMMQFHLMVEAMSRAFADRNTHLADPGFVQVPTLGLLAPEYLEARAKTISLDRHTPSSFVKPGDVWSQPSRRYRSTPQRHESDNTTHVSIVDADGGIVALSTTLNGGFGSGVIVEGAGFFLNNEMDDFDAQPGQPNQFGLVGGESNAIQPGKRMLSSMAPTIVLKDERPWLVFGARGGPRIITALIQILLNRYEFDMDLEQAVAAPRFHHQWLPDAIWSEEGTFDRGLRGRLQRMGHELRDLKPYKSSAQCIEIVSDSLLIGVSDPRTQGGAASFATDAR